MLYVEDRQDKGASDVVGTVVRDRDPPRCESPNCFCLAAANCCGSLLITTWSLACVIFLLSEV